MGLFRRLFGNKRGPDETTKAKQVPSASFGGADGQSILDITKTLEEAKARHQLPEPDQIVSALVAVEETANYATLVEIMLKTSAEIRGVHVGDLKSAYMKLWWQWHNHRDELPYRAKKAIVIASEAARVLSGSEISWTLVSVLLAWFGRGCPDTADELKTHFGNAPSLEEIGKYQTGTLGLDRTDASAQGSTTPRAAKVEEEVCLSCLTRNPKAATECRSCGRSFVSTMGVEVIAKETRDMNDAMAASGAGLVAHPEFTRVTNRKDGSELVTIPEGEFLAGGAEPTEGGGKPFHVQLAAYCLGVYPVTNAQYAQFMKETGHPCPATQQGMSIWENGVFPPERADHPVVSVSWDDAKAYCDWAGLRLPTELEWEKGARGVDGLEYPWGNKWEKDLCRNHENASIGRICGTAPVQWYGRGASPWGCMQMAGNVWEWCADYYDHTYYRKLKAAGGRVDATRPDVVEGASRVLRGGSSGDTMGHCRCAHRKADNPARRQTNIGFRVAKSPEAPANGDAILCRCSHCGRTNRVLRACAEGEPICGACKQPLSLPRL